MALGKSPQLQRNGDLRIPPHLKGGGIEARGTKLALGIVAEAKGLLRNAKEVCVHFSVSVQIEEELDGADPFGELEFKLSHTCGRTCAPAQAQVERRFRQPLLKPSAVSKIPR